MDDRRGDRGAGGKGYGGDDFSESESDDGNRSMTAYNLFAIDIFFVCGS